MPMGPGLAIAETTSFINESNVLRHRRLGNARAGAPATCGELVQGYLDGQDFLINSPVDLYSQVSVTLTREADVFTETPGIFTKSERAVRLTLDQLGLRSYGAILRIPSEIPRGKGLASSTSEITAAIMATAEAAGHHLSTSVISRIAVSIEPSDGIYFPGVVMYDHLGGGLLEVFGEPPPLAFCIVDTGGTVDTVSFDRERFRANAREHESQIRTAVEKVTRGFRLKNARLIAEGATLSAQSNHMAFPKPAFPELLKAVRSVGALGVNCAHSGTVLGVMYDPTHINLAHLLRTISNIIGQKNILGCFNLVSGGVKLKGAP
jgi:L-threonine kinase